ncbi:MAG TPA: hypothetical protein VIG33_10890, partial [Pseudobdellovibrionaceae bacterium]
MEYHIVVADLAMAYKKLCLFAIIRLRTISLGRTLPGSNECNRNVFRSLSRRGFRIPTSVVFGRIVHVYIAKTAQL